jgi:hypothetical protein
MAEIQDGIGAGGSHKVKMFVGRDFHLWKFQFLTYAEFRDVNGYFDGSEVKPSEEAPEEEKRRWKKGDSLARTILLTALDYNQMQLVTTCTTSKEMWDRLKGKFEKESLSHQAKLKREFHNLRKGEKKFDTYIKEFDAMCDKLRGVGLFGVKR